MEVISIQCSVFGSYERVVGVKRGRRVFLILMGCGVVAVVAVLVWPKEKEPEYKGKRLSEWIYLGYYGADQDEAAEAVRAFGTNAFPWLMQAIQYEPSDRRKKIIALEEEIPRVISGTLRLDRLAEGSGERKAAAAGFGFHVLGADASPTVPVLTLLLRSTNSNVSSRAIKALAEIGDAGLPPLVEALNDPGFPQRETAANFLVYSVMHWAEGGKLAPVFLSHLTDSNPVVADVCMRGLLAVDADPNACVPALIERAGHTNAAVRKLVAQVMGKFGETTPSVVPVLERLTQDSDETVALAATLGLRRIARKALKNGVSGDHR